MVVENVALIVVLHRLLLLWQSVLADWDGFLAEWAGILLHDPRADALGVEDVLDVARHLAYDRRALKIFLADGALKGRSVVLGLHVCKRRLLIQ